MRPLRRTPLKPWTRRRFHKSRRWFKPLWVIRIEKWEDWAFHPRHFLCGLWRKNLGSIPFC